LTQYGHYLYRKGNTQKYLTIVCKEGMSSAKLEILIGIEVPAKRRVQMESGVLWSKPRMRCNGSGTVVVVFERGDG
jgi:hypothetical protein